MSQLCGNIFGGCLSDVHVIRAWTPDPSQTPDDDSSYCWLYTAPEKDEFVEIGAGTLIEDMEDIDSYLTHFPSPEYSGLLPEPCTDDSRYSMSHWGFCLFERHWSLRGTENARMDFYLSPDEVQKLYQKLADFYMRVMERAHEKYGVDRIFTTDDIGAQKTDFLGENLSGIFKSRTISR